MSLGRNQDRQLTTECCDALLRKDKAAYDAFFGLLYREHNAGILSIARRITRNPQDAEEVTNDAFSDLNRFFPRVDPDRGCFGLLRIFTFRRAAEKYTRVGVFHEKESFDPDKHSDPVSNSATAEEKLIDRSNARIQLSKAKSLAGIVCGRAAGAPHERIVFLFCRTLSYKPARLVETKVSERRLGAGHELGGLGTEALEPELEHEWVRRSDLQPDQIYKIFEPLRKDMEIVLRSYPLHGRTRELYSDKPIWGQAIWQGRLREYFRNSPPTEDIRMWCVNVEKRVVKLARNLK
jgi:DNA-directed RNA polymerase specialized sigma24 family protein